jgi:dTDP-4-dehydrorhamnose reductase
MINYTHQLAGKRILLVGAGGQVGIALQQIMPTSVQLIALNRNDLNITDRKAVAKVVNHFRPDWVVNAAAYTAVDNAESEPEAAFAINRDGVVNIADAVAEVNSRMVHISTDYVFDGNQARPYRPSDAVNPINVYGQSKLAGEFGALEILDERLLILRTSWVYAPHGNNFLTSMLRLFQVKEEVKVVEDQVGTPTSAYSLADTILVAMGLELTGIHHWTDAGAASWYDFACSIKDLVVKYGDTSCISRITPIPSSGYPTPAERPMYSLLDKQSLRTVIGGNGRQWEIELNRVMSRIPTRGI